ncbi:MAG: TraM recognition domain-containing protein [bacterium]
MEGIAQPIQTPEEELAYLRAQVAAKENELRGLRRESAPPVATAEIVHERIIHHKETPAEEVLAPAYQMPETEVKALALNLDPKDDDATITELMQIIETRGIRNALSVLEKMDNPHIEDDFHRFLVQYVLSGMQVKGLDEKAPTWKALHMTLYEVALPEPDAKGEGREKPLKELVSAMEQFYAGMLSVGEAYAGEPRYFSMELAVPVGRADLLFYVAVPNGKRDLFEKQLLAIFPHAHIAPQPNDYNVFAEDGTSLVSVAKLSEKPMLPLKDYADFDYDPLNGILNAFAKIAAEGEGAALQLLIEPAGDRYLKHYRKVLDALRKGKKRSEAFSLPETAFGEVAKEFGSFFLPGGKSRDGQKQREAEQRQIEANKTDIEALEKKLGSPVVEATMRLVVSGTDAVRAGQVQGELESAFNQFGNTRGNTLAWERPSGSTGKRAIRDFSFRTAVGSALPLSLKEVTTLYHFPPNGIKSAPSLKQARFSTAAAPLTLSGEGTQIGTNTFRGVETKVFIADEDRLRHLYAIGQTGAGKTGLLRTLIDQDVRAGKGVCFIDPHGNDILEVLAGVPPERYEDVIYFDPADTSRPFGLNLLEYDPSRPEQKTFIVNEILAIFRRLYGDVPESMGPAFEQYFRNATLLVMEDPASGSTILDIPRVLANKAFRDLKLSRSNNPVVNQFWTEIATKAEGEASLQNIVPYITNKFDDFTANDFMRPIVGQQQSSFHFREVIDNKKILLVNLSKGRLGERNANLIGLIVVGKLFMAALSRADNPRAEYNPFYLYIDEFQNITTDSIPGILSEARKYKLSLTMAHQFLSQVDEKIRDAVFGNVGNMAVFRVGEEDAEFFEKQFAPAFSATDFVNLENRNAYVRILAGGVPQKPFNIKTLNLKPGNPDQIDDLRQLSSLTYGRDRGMVEGMIRSRYIS